MEYKNMMPNISNNLNIVEWAMKEKEKLDEEDRRRMNMIFGGFKDLTKAYPLSQVSENDFNPSVKNHNVDNDWWNTMTPEDKLKFINMGYMRLGGGV